MNHFFAILHLKTYFITSTEDVIKITDVYLFATVSADK